MKGCIRQALTSALPSILETRNPESSVRAWTLWLLLPRMLLHRPPGIRILPKADWHHRMHQFQNGHWLELLAAARLAANTNPDTTTANTQPSPQQRADRARHLVHLGELSAARQALTAGPTAPCTQQTLDELRDPSRRPAALYEPPDDQITTFQPEQPAELPMATIIQNLRRSRKGAAPGPSGLTADTLRLLLADEPATHQLATVAQHVARAQVPATIASALGLGRVVALRKPNGRVCGIIIGDFLRRLVARSLAQHYATAIHAACAPHQFALSTRAGTETLSEPSPLPPKPTTSTQSSRSTASERTTPSPGQA